MLPGRSRSDVSVSVSKSKGIGGLDEKKAIVVAASVNTNAINANYKTSIDDRAVLPRFENSGMGLKCSDEIGDDDAALMVRLPATHDQLLAADGPGRTIRSSRSSREPAEQA
jgi:hypothetical protein